MYMVTKREYLIEKGLAKATRGRLSAKAHEEIKRAINKGIKFTEPGSDASTGISETPDPRHDRPEGYYTFANPDGTKFKRLHTEACANCCYSLRWCFCVSGPVQWAYDSVTGEYATLDVVPKRPQVVAEDQPKPRRRRAPKKAA